MKQCSWEKNSTKGKTIATFPVTQKQRGRAEAGMKAIGALERSKYESAAM
jgi:hypothetical protein